MFQGPIAGKLAASFTGVEISSQAQQELIKQLSILPRDNYSLLTYICR